MPAEEEQSFRITAMRFITAHSSSPDWPQALDAIAGQVAAARARAGTVTRPNLGLVYLQPGLAPPGPRLLQDLRARLGVAHWVGAEVAHVFAGADQGIVDASVGVMLLQLAQRDFRVFSGLQPLPAVSRGWRGAHTALVHGDSGEDELDELLAELGARTASGDAWGGVLAPCGSLQLADAALRGGVSGLALSSRVSLLGGLSQGLQAVGPARTVTRCADNVVYALDGQPALGALLDDLGQARSEREDEQWRALVPSLREVVVGLSWPQQTPPGSPQSAVLRGLIGIDPRAQGVALAAEPQPGMRLRFCRREQQESLRDLLRLCTEVREDIEQRRQVVAQAGHRHATQPMRGAVFISCAGRSEAAHRAERQLVRSQLGDVPLLGFRAAGEVSGGALHAYSSVLRVFASDPSM